MKLSYSNQMYVSDDAVSMSEIEITEPTWIKRELWDDCTNREDFKVIEVNDAEGWIRIEPVTGIR